MKFIEKKVDEQYEVGLSRSNVLVRARSVFVRLDWSGGRPHGQQKCLPHQQQRSVEHTVYCSTR